MSIRTLIVDDEPLLRQRLELLLRQEPDIELVGECAGGEAAVLAITRARPDLLFLDVQMVGMDGFTVLRALPREGLPAVIFTTGHDQHAVQAFDVHALDYLLKPFTSARFKEALQRAREHFACVVKRDGLELAGPRPGRDPYLSRLTVKAGDKVVILKIADIDTIESAGNYITVQSGKESLVLRETLNALEAQLDPKKFMRISRSAIVNLERVKELLPKFKGEHAIVLHNGKHLLMTRRLREVERALRFS